MNPINPSSAGLLSQLTNSLNTSSLQDSSSLQGPAPLGNDSYINDQGLHTGQLNRAATGILGDAFRSHFEFFPIENSPPIVSFEHDFGSESVANRILGFIDNRIQSAINSGASEDDVATLVAQAREGVAQGYGEALDILQGSGLLSGQVQSEVSVTYDLLQSGLNDIENFYLGSPSAEQAPVETTKAPSQLPNSLVNGLSAVSSSREAVYARSESLDVEITTRDGDVVMLSLSSQQASYRGSGFLGAQSPGGSALVATSQRYDYASSQFQYTVEGVLDSGERKALNDLLSQIDKLAIDFYEGNIDEAFQQALELGFDSSELVGFALDIQQVEVKAVRETYAAVASAGDDYIATDDSALSRLSDYMSDLNTALEKARVFDAPSDLVSDLLAGILSLIDRDESDDKENHFQKIMDVNKQLLDALLA